MPLTPGANVDYSLKLVSNTLVETTSDGFDYRYPGFDASGPRTLLLSSIKTPAGAR